MAQTKRFIYWLKVAKIYSALTARNSTREAVSDNIIYSAWSFHKRRIETHNETTCSTSVITGKRFYFLQQLSYFRTVKDFILIQRRLIFCNLDSLPFKAQVLCKYLGAMHAQHVSNAQIQQTPKMQVKYMLKLLHLPHCTWMLCWRKAD